MDVKNMEMNKEKENIYEEECRILLQNGVNIKYVPPPISNGSRYVNIKVQPYPFVNGKVVYVVVKGTSIAYIFPYDILITHQWFNNILGNSGFKTNFINLPAGNILLPVDCPIPLKFNLIYDKIMKGSITEYIHKEDQPKLKDLFDYFGIDISFTLNNI